jgi:signal transduction histidine kinase
MSVTAPRADPVTLQLLKLSSRNAGATIAACDRELRYTHLINPHPAFREEDALGLRDDEMAPAGRVAELVAVKKEVLAEGRDVRRRIRVNVDGEEVVYDVTAEPIRDDADGVVGVATAAMDVTPARDVQVLLGQLSARLSEQSRTITEQWHAHLKDRLNVRPQHVFPGESLLDGVPRLVEWLARSVTNGQELSGANVDSLREIAEHWKHAGYSVEESLLHVRFLSDLLLDALRDAAVEAGRGLEPTAGIEAARRLVRGVDMAKVALVAAYRDAEEDRFTDFGATLAHEVRDHLHAAATGVQLIQALQARWDEGDTEGRDRVLGRIEHSLEQASQVVDSVQSLSRAAAGDHDWTRRPLPDILAALVEEGRGRALSEGIELVVEDGIPDVSIPADPVHLILHNLLDNAVKYADPRKTGPWVRIGAERDAVDGHLVIRVGDNGLGIPEPEQERIFLRFRRGAAATGDGFGLGLAIVRETARKFGGRVLLESEPGRGSTFSLTVPAAQLRD